MFFVTCEFNLTLEISQTAKGTFLYIRLKCVFPTEQLASCFCLKTHTGKWYLLINIIKIGFAYNVFRKGYQKNIWEIRLADYDFLLSVWKMLN